MSRSPHDSPLPALVLLALIALPVAGRAVNCGEASTDGLEPEVASAVDQALQLFRTTEQPDAAAHGELAMQLHAQALHDAALPCYQRAELLDLADPRWPYLAALIHEAEGDLERAASAFRSTLHAQPDYLPARLSLARVLRQLGEVERAALPLQVLDASQSAAAVRAALGEQAMAEERYSDAASHFEAAIAAAPDADRLHYLLAEALRGMGETRRAREHFERAGTIGVRADDPFLAAVRQRQAGDIALVLRGRRALAAGDVAEAAASFAAALERNPDSIEARVNLGTALHQLGREREAAAAFSEVLNRQPDNRAALFNLAAIAEPRQPEVAMDLYRKLLEMAPDDAEAHLRLGRLLAAAGDQQAAAGHLSQARSDLRFYPEAMLALATMAVANQREGDAIALLREARGLAPTDPRLAGELVRLLAGATDLSVRDGTEALALAQRMHEALGSAGTAQLVALAHAESGDCQAAAEWLTQAAELTTAADQQERLRALRAQVAGQETCRP